MRPEIHVLQDWPAAMCAKLAAQYLDVSPPQFARIEAEYPDRLRPMSLLPKGEKKWSRVQLDEFIAFKRIEEAG